MLASLTLAATTEPRDLLAGPRTAAAARPARADHGLHDPLPRRGHRRDAAGCGSRASPAASPPATSGTGRWSARSAGALFIRSYERGERVHLAMLSRGYTGRMPDPTSPAPEPVTPPVAEPGPRPRRAGLALRLPRRSPGAVRRRPARARAASGSPLLGPNGAGKTTLVLHLNGILTAGAGSVAVSGLPVDKRAPAGGPAPGRRRLPGPRRPAVHADRARRRGVRAGATSGCAAPSLDRRVDDALDRVGHGRASSTGRRTTSLRPAAPGRGGDRARHGAGDPGARRAVVEPGPGLAGASWPRSCARSTSRC